MKNGRIVIILIGILLLSLLVSNFRRIYQTISGAGSSKVFTVELREEGFTPNKITVNKGDTVKFTTNRGKFFWPASDLHPTHDIYPEFDPKEPIASASSWSFRFEKVGTWKYHDHLEPYYRGEITVLAN